MKDYAIWNANTAFGTGDSFICMPHPRSVNIYALGDSYRETGTLLYKYNRGHPLHSLRSCQFNFGCATPMAFEYDATPHIYNNITNHCNNNSLPGGRSESHECTETFAFTNFNQRRDIWRWPLSSLKLCQLQMEESITTLTSAWTSDDSKHRDVLVMIIERSGQISHA